MKNSYKFKEKKRGRKWIAQVSPKEKWIFEPIISLRKMSLSSQLDGISHRDERFFQRCKSLNSRSRRKKNERKSPRANEIMRVTNKFTLQIRPDSAALRSSPATRKPRRDYYYNPCLVSKQGLFLVWHERARINIPLTRVNERVVCTRDKESHLMSRFFSWFHYVINNRERFDFLFQFSVLYWRLVKNGFVC